MAKLSTKKIETIVTTLCLLALAGIIQWLNASGKLERYPLFATIMLISTAIYVFVGCVLQTFNFHKAAIILGVVVFFIICTCLFYSVAVTDFIIFFVCMAVVIRKSSKTCDCFSPCERPLT